MEKKEIEYGETAIQEQQDDLFTRAILCKLTDEERHSAATWLDLMYCSGHPMSEWTDVQKHVICGQMPAGMFEEVMSKINSVSEDMQSYRKEAVNRANRHEYAELELYEFRLPHYPYGRIKNMEIVSFEHGYEFAMKKLKSLVETACAGHPEMKDVLDSLISEMEK